MRNNKKNKIEIDIHEALVVGGYIPEVTITDNDLTIEINYYPSLNKTCLNNMSIWIYLNEVRELLLFDKSFRIEVKEHD